MRGAWLAVAGLWLACVAGVDGRAAWADGANPPPPPPPVWRGARPRAPAPSAAPRTRGHVPVPDVRGLSEQAATQSLYAAGLQLGGVERVSLAKLEAELGKQYRPGIVVQQAPRPSVGESPSWLPRGSAVWLRLSEGVAVTGPSPGATPVPPLWPTPLPVPPQPMQPVQPVQPVVPYPGPSTAGIPTRPPPPAWPGVAAVPGPATVPYVPPTTVPYVPPTTVPYVPPATVPYVPPATRPLDPTPEPLGAALVGTRFAPRLRLACERGRGQWHVRAAGGWAWWLGADSGASGAIAAGDLGYTFGDCFGVDVFYRYASTRFDRTMGGITFGDGGDIHFIGAKATYEAGISRTSQWYFWGGLGAGWFKTERFAQDDSGLGIMGDVGLGYLFSRSVRGRVGLTVESFLTNAGRNDPANDGSRRWLTGVAPMLGLEIDF